MMKCAVYVAESNGDQVFIAGVSLPWKGFGEVWIRPGESIGKYLSAGKYARDLIDFVTVKFSLRRVQAQIEKRNRKNVRFAEWLGFYIESEIPDYGPNGESYLMMRRR